MSLPRRYRGINEQCTAAARAASYRSLWRLRSYVRPYTPQMLVMLACATLAVAASTLIPLVLEAVVNGPIHRGDRGALVPMFLIALGLGIAEPVLIVGRRRVQSVAIQNIEREIRDGMYARLQRLPIEFHDRWQTGQLLSRCTTDLGTIRRFLGFGAIFFIVDALQYLAVMALLIATYPPLGALAVVTTMPVIWIAKRFGAGYTLISRRLQDQQGDLATLTEEAASGIARREGFRPRSPHAGSLRRLGPHSSWVRPRDGSLASALLGIAHSCPQRDDGLLCPHRGHSRRPWGALLGSPRCLHDAFGPRAISHHRSRLDPVDGPRGSDGLGSDLRGLRRGHGRR